MQLLQQNFEDQGGAIKIMVARQYETSENARVVGDPN